MKDSPELTSRYELDRVLSWQGPTRTYEARDPASGDTVAVKIISLGTVPEAQVLKQRFLATAGVLRTLDHPNLPRLLDFGVTADGEAFLIFDWIDGATLDRVGELAPRQILPYVLQAIEGLECLALHGLVHLNLAPENLLVTPEGEIKLLGLGASLFRVDWQSPLALGGMAAGTGIAAPELQVTMAAGSALWRADLYALAFVTCALLDAEVDGAGTASPAVRFPERVARQLHASEELAGALARCLHIDPSQRPVSYSNLGKVLQHSLPRAPRAGTVVRDTQVFDVGELAASQPPGVGRVPADERPPQPEDEPSAEMMALRTDLESSLADGELKQPSDLGREAEIYEGFLEIREESAPVEIDLSPRAGETPEGRESGSSQETVLVPEMSADVDAERHSVSPAPPETRETVRAPATQAPTEGTAAEPPGRLDGEASPPPADPSPGSPFPQAAPRSPLRSARPQPPSEETEVREEVPPPAGPGRRLAPVPPALGSKPLRAPSRAERAESAVPSPPSKPTPSGSPVRGRAPGPAAARPAAKTPSGQTGPAQRPRPGTSRRAPAPVAAPSGAVGGATPAPGGGASAARTSAAARSRSRSPLVRPVLERLAGSVRTVRRRSRGLDRRVVVAAAGVTLVTVSSLAAVLFWPATPGASTEPSIPAAEQPRSSIPELPPGPEPVSVEPAELPAALQEAVALLDQDELLEARRRLDEVAQLAEEGALDDAALEAYRAVEEIVVRRRSERLEEELQAALRNGNVSRLRQSLATVAVPEEELLAETSSGRLALSDARRARSLLDSFDDALADGDRLAALDTAFRLAEAFPVFDSALRARERATAAVEGEVDRLIEDGRLEDAEQHLTLLRSMWPDRPGIDGKLGTVRSRMESEARFDTVLAAARAAGSRGRPHEGLRLLASVQPKREYVERFERQRESLARQLSELDAEAPTVRLPDAELEFKKGEPAVVELESRDDYLVAEVTFWARNHEQDEYTELTARRVDEGVYRVEVAPSFHGDKNFRFWASVRDVSGNEGRLGSPESPVEVKRKRWFR